MKVTEGPNAGKLALLDFGLVAEVPKADREAMVSATLHLGNRDWDALIDDFIALGFLPADSDRGRIIPVMDKVLSPYLRGGGAKAFNFQVRRLSPHPVPVHAVKQHVIFGRRATSPVPCCDPPGAC